MVNVWLLIFGKMSCEHFSECCIIFYCELSGVNARVVVRGNSSKKVETCNGV